jgi:hypothetical protein
MRERFNVGEYAQSGYRASLKLFERNVEDGRPLVAASKPLGERGRVDGRRGDFQCCDRTHKLRRKGYLPDKSLPEPLRLLILTSRLEDDALGMLCRVVGLNMSGEETRRGWCELDRAGQRLVRVPYVRMRRWCRLEQAGERGIDGGSSRRLLRTLTLRNASMV